MNTIRKIDIEKYEFFTFMKTIMNVFYMQVYKKQIPKKLMGEPKLYDIFYKTTR